MTGTRRGRIGFLLPVVFLAACGPALEEVRDDEPEPPLPIERVQPPVQEPPKEQPPEDPDLRKVTFVTPKAQPVTLRYKAEGRSIGAPNAGSLEGGRCIGAEGPGFVHFGDSGCGTVELVTLLTFCLLEVQKEHPGTPPVVVGSLSSPGGGRLRPHKSHRSGRDVDIGFYATRNRPMTSLQTLSPEEIDWDKTFFLMANMIATGKVQMIFVNYGLQPYLYEAGKRMGYDDEQLGYIIQYPRGSGNRIGVIRHARGHTRHFHVRFACPAGDSECTD